MPRADWFHALTGFHEHSYADTQSRLQVTGTTLRSTVNGRSFEIGALDIPSVRELRERALPVAPEQAGALKVSQLWTMQNGYALCTSAGLEAITRRLDAASEPERDGLRDLLRVGVHSDVEVTAEQSAPHQRVSQVFCSALPVSYSQLPDGQWTAFATLILEGAYEATLWAAVLNAARGRSNAVYLTQLGGGAFGNDASWIHAAIRRMLTLAQGLALDVRLVSYRAPSAELRRLAAEFA